MQSSRPKPPDDLDVYGAYARAFLLLRRSSTEETVSVTSVASAFERLLAVYPEDLAPVMALALRDAMGCLPIRSPDHLRRELAKDPSWPFHG